MSIKLLDSLARQYIKKGFTIFGHLNGRPQSPDDWRGPFPDMIAEKDGDQIAFLGAAHDVCLEQFDRRRLDAALDNPGCSVHLLSSCINCNCGIDELIRSLPDEMSRRVMVRRFAPGKVMFPEIPQALIAGLTWKSLSILLLLISTGMAISVALFRSTCG